MSRSTVLMLLVTTGLLGACGTQTSLTGQDTDPNTHAVSPDIQVVDPEDELVGVGMLMQAVDGGPVELCVGGVADSYPPQCSGPVLEGDFSWDDVQAERASGVTWTNDAYFAVGHFDPDAGEEGTLTLTRPVSDESPAGLTPPEGPENTFPQLCQDPTAGVADIDQASRTEGTGVWDEEEALFELTESMDGYVTSWVSDGHAVMNVVVTTDADQARTQIREVFHGPLCVEQRDLPTQDELRAAQKALTDEWAELRVLSSGSGGTTDLLDIQVLLADQATVDRVHELVAPWLTPTQVLITSALVPLSD